MMHRLAIALVLFFLASGVHAQGQDSTPWARDLQVVAELMAGGFDNANQSYFDRRTDRSVKHRRLHVEVSRIEAPNVGEFVFVASGYWDNDEAEDAGDYLWVLSEDDEASAVRMQSWPIERSADADAVLDGDVLADLPSCVLHWRREAAQFRATGDGACDAPVPLQMVLSDEQLWMSMAGEGEDYQLHRVREFECYADIPGVGGGRDEPYDRYEGFRTHDMGGQIWFTSNEGRELGISLFLVDWPINNYHGSFTRDSFVIYVSENVDGERRELGYAFTVPHADRIGINLKWMLASCFMKSNRLETPFM